MPLPNKQKALDDIDRVLAHRPAAQGGSAASQERITMCRACIDRWAPPGSPYRGVSDGAGGHISREEARLWGAVKALRADIEADALATFAELVHASIASDLLAQSEQLLESSYRLAAAVITGATLEEHLRTLAAKCPTVAAIDGSGRPTKLANLNDQLAKAGAYSRADHDLASGWIRIRNEAAHKEAVFEGRTDAEIRIMTAGVRDFIARHPA